jgi:hypothetical protein
MPDSEERLPEFYIDQFRVTTGAFGVAMTFGLTEPHPTQGGVPRSAEEKVRIRMSLEHAKIMTMLLRRQLKGFEEQFGINIQVPPGVYTGLGVAEEDWR